MTSLLSFVPLKHQHLEQVTLLPWLGLLGLISGCWLEEKDTAPGVSKSRGKKFSDQWGTPPCARDSDKQGSECSLIIAGEAEDGDGCAVVLDSLQDNRDTTESHSWHPTPEQQEQGLGWSARTDCHRAASPAQAREQRRERCWARSPCGPGKPPGSSPAPRTHHMRSELKLWKLPRRVTAGQSSQATHQPPVMCGDGSVPPRASAAAVGGGCSRALGRVTATSQRLRNIFLLHGASSPFLCLSCPRTREFSDLISRFQQKSRHEVLNQNAIP